MGSILPSVLKMSLTASVVIAMVLLCRCFLKKAPKIFSYALWSVVLFRLLCPVTVTSSISMLQMLQTPVVNENITLTTKSNTLHTANQAVTSTAVKNSNSGAVSSETEQMTVKNAEDGILAIQKGVTLLWIAGMAVMILYSGVSLLKLKKQLIGSVRIRDNIYQADQITSPFVIGIRKPRIYLASGLKETEQEYILLHEQTHIKRGDHVVKILAFLALTIHWFNPLVWVAFHFANKDMEMSCDEAVMKKMGSDIRADYSNSLLSLATGKNIISGAPLLFGEGDTKARIKNVMHYKKPAIAVVFVACVLVSGIVLALGSDPKTSAATKKTTETSATKTNTTKTQQSAKVKKAAVKWAKAFCNRDVDKILALSSNQAQKQLEENGLLMTEDGDSSFGYSSPWPWDEDSDYQIISYSNKSAEILYYAWVSDPHVTVWKEKITFKLKDKNYIVTSEEYESYDYIASGEEFYNAYPDGLSNTPMDYKTNGVGEALNDNAKSNEQSEYYSDLFEPESAARYLLNLLDNPMKVKIVADKADSDGNVTVHIYFREDGVEVLINMIQPYGAGGIWIPEINE